MRKWKLVKTLYEWRNDEGALVYSAEIDEYYKVRITNHTHNDPRTVVVESYVLDDLARQVAT